MLSQERLEELRAEAKADSLDIPPVAIAWTEAEARAFFESDGKEVPSLDAPASASEIATRTLTEACDKLSLEYKSEAVLQGRLRKGALIGTGGTALVYLATHEPSEAPADPRSAPSGPQKSRYQRGQLGLRSRSALPLAPIAS